MLIFGKSRRYRKIQTIAYDSNLILQPRQSTKLFIKKESVKRMDQSERYQCVDVFVGGGNQADENNRNHLSTYYKLSKNYDY